ncbi:hypothetical protein GCM10010174_33550 [Kutzneria viridogrisea]|uniref:3beta-hydroxysteroid 3-dehydrogenase n=1 Tax=Kutzneria viridogrisea TaxID=47990 RepID=A0ABR6BRS8_9PSEU|nr:NAD(P)-dependent dehydrogenase (short-subunit alcohol dehydrogenase family) [Kutzneria viridogrisea]
MAMPQGRTTDGFETQLGINHLGHWALTTRLLPALVRTRDARVVTVTSGAQHTGRPLDPGDPFLLRDYDPWRAYGNSKLANRHFAQGLDRQFQETGLSVRALTAHPGLTNSDIQSTTVTAGGGGGLGRFFLALTRRIGMDTERGALSPLRAATDPRAVGGALYGPRWGMAGAPVRRRLIRPGADRAIRLLWQVSWQLTGLDIDVARVAARTASTRRP